MIELNSINLATEEDRNYEIDKWTSLFKATTWEDIHMLINDNPTLQSAAETLYQLNMNEQFRETCDRFIRAEAEHNALLRINAELTKENATLLAEISELKARLELQEKVSEKYSIYISRPVISNRAG